VDHLAGAEASAVPSETVELAALRCAEEARDFTTWLRERESARTIEELRERGDAIRERQLARAMRRLGHLSERDREVVESLAAGLTHALLHEPTVRMRGRPDVEDAARSLFGLDGASTSPYPGRADRAIEQPYPESGARGPQDEGEHEARGRALPDRAVERLGRASLPDRGINLGTRA
jgi:glutamyl-tRNA reductase